MSKRKLSDAPLPRNKAPKPKSLESRNQYTIGIITALEIEFTAARAVLDEPHGPPDDYTASDRNFYKWGTIADHNIVIACLAEGMTGKVSAATTVVNMIRSIPSIRFGLMVGIGGGIPAPGNDIRLGDVIVSKPEGNVGGVVQYDLGKSTSHGFLRTGFLNGPPESLLRAVTSLRSDHNLVGTSIPDIIEEISSKLRASEHNYQYPGPERDHLFQTHYDHRTGLDCSACDSAMRTRRIERQEPDMPKIHYGLIASGDRVMKNAAEREDLAAKLEGDVGAKCLCFEMEAAGLMNSFPCLVIRGISDYSDSHKNNGWQPYAAMTAAAYAKELLGELSVEAVAETPKVTKEVLEAVQRVDESVKELQSAVDQMMGSSDSGDVRDWLKAPDPSVNYNMAIQTRHKNTGNWLLSHCAIKDFEAANSRFIWLQGNSGSGKTVLAASVIKKFGTSRTQSSTVLYFFFDFRDPFKQSLDGLIRSLLQQIFAGPYDLRAKDTIKTLFWDCGCGSSEPAIDRLVATLDLAISEMHEVIIILDALDECPAVARMAVLEWICQRLAADQSNRAKVRLFVTSRSNQPDIDCEFGTLEVKPRILFVESEDDIHGFIQSRLHTGKDFQVWRTNPEDHVVLKSIEETVVSKAGTMFRLANLQLQELGRCDSLAAIKVALETLPNDLNTLYNRALSQIPELCRRGVGQLLQFLLYSGTEIDKQSALDIMAVNPGSLDPHESFRKENLMRSLRSISPIFSCLILERTLQDGHATVAIGIAHSSVKDFLEGGIQVEAFDTRFTCPEGEIDVIRVVSCYLLSVPSEFEEEKRKGKQDPGNLPILRRGLRALSRQIFLAIFPNQSIENRLQDLIFQVFREMSHESTFPVCFGPLNYPSTELYATDNRQPFKPQFNMKEEIPSPPNPGLVRACALKACGQFGLTKTLKLLLEQGADLNGAFSPHSTPPLVAACGLGLHRACADDVPKLLLDAGADPNISGGKNRESALMAALESHSATDTKALERLDLLLQRGTNIDSTSPGKWGHTVLFRICLVKVETGWDDCTHFFDEICSRAVKPLLDRGADPNSRAINVERQTLEEDEPSSLPLGAPEEYLTPLELSLKNGLSEAVKFLVDDGAMFPPNSNRDRIYWSFVCSRFTDDPIVQDVVLGFLKLSPKAQTFYTRVWPSRWEKIRFIQAAISAKDEFLKTETSSWHVDLFSVPADRGNEWFIPNVELQLLALAFEWTYLASTTVGKEATLTMEIDEVRLGHLHSLGPRAWDDEIRPTVGKFEHLLDASSPPGSLAWAIEQSLRLDITIEIHLSLSAANGDQIFRFRRTVNIERQLYDPSEYYLNKPILAHCRNQIIKKWYRTRTIPRTLKGLRSNLKRPIRSPENNWTKPDRSRPEFVDFIMREVERSRLIKNRLPMQDEQTTIQAMWDRLQRFVDFTGLTENRQYEDQDYFEYDCRNLGPQPIFEKHIKGGANVNSLSGAESPLSLVASIKKGPEVFRRIEMLLDHGANMIRSLSVLPRESESYKRLTTFCIDAAFNKGDLAKVEHHLKEVDLDDAIVIAAGWQRTGLVEYLFKTRAKSSIAESCHRRVALAEMAFRQDQTFHTNSHKLLLSGVDSKKALSCACSKRLLVVTAYFLEDETNDAWLENKESRLFALEAALTYKTYALLCPTFMSPSRQVQIFHDACKAGVDLTQLRGLAKDQVGWEIKAELIRSIKYETLSPERKEQLFWMAKDVDCDLSWICDKWSIQDPTQVATSAAQTQNLGTNDNFD